VNVLLVRHFQQIKDLESRLSQYIAENSSLKTKLASARTPAEWDHLEAQLAEKTQINNDLLRQVNELTADKRDMEEELKKLDSLRQAIRQLDVFRSWTSAES
jgi:cell division protein FtsL